MLETTELGFGPYPELTISEARSSCTLDVGNDTVDGAGTGGDVGCDSCVTEGTTTVGTGITDVGKVVEVSCTGGGMLETAGVGLGSGGTVAVVAGCLAKPCSSTEDTPRSPLSTSVDVGVGSEI